MYKKVNFQIIKALKFVLTYFILANGSLVRPLPSDFGEPQPSKLVKYACEVCNVAVNSEIQLQQV